MDFIGRVEKVSGLVTTFQVQVIFFQEIRIVLKFNLISIHKNNIVRGYLFSKFSVCILAVMLLCKLNGQAGHSEKGRDFLHERRKYLKKRQCLTLKKTQLISVLTMYRNRTIDLLCNSVDWFLYNGFTGLIGIFISINCFQLLRTKL